MKKYSIKDIARLSGVSVATVSRVINNNGRFSEETRKKVLSVIEQTNYKINYSAKSLRMNKSFTIGILVPDIKNYFFSDLVQKIEEILFEQGYTTIICNTARNAEKEQAYLQILQAKGVDGLIIISGVEAFSMNAASSEKKIPYICIDREPQDKSKTIFISSNHYQGAEAATESLIDSGAKNLAIALYNRMSSASRSRLSGFEETLKKHQLGFDAEKNSLRISSDDTINQELDNFLKNNPTVDGFFSTNDTLAMKLNSRLKKIGKNVPQDIKMIGFDDTPYGEYSSPTLSSVRQNTQQLAQKTVESLLKLMDSSTTLGETILIPVELIVRESSSRI